METYLDNKQNQAIQKYLDTVDFQQIGLRALVEINLQKFLETYDAGHAAATAEGIPQADGWVDVADRLPAQSDLSGYLNDSVFTWSAVGGDDGWASVGRFDIERQKFIGDGYVIAWMPIRCDKESEKP